MTNFYILATLILLFVSIFAMIQNRTTTFIGWELIPMSNFIYFSLIPENLPTISTLNITHIDSPYIHFQRQYHEFILYYILSGELFLTEDTQAYHLRKNDCLLLDPSRTHFGQQASTYQLFYIHFSLPTLLESFLTAESIKNQLQKQQTVEPSLNDASPIYLPKYHSIRTPSTLTQVHSLLNSIFESFCNHELYHHLETSCLLYQLLISLAKDFSYQLIYDAEQIPSSFHETVPLLLNYLNQSYSMKISSSLIETKYNCNFDYLNRMFKKMTGQTIFIYLNRLRIQKAKQLLSTGFYSISDIASQTGFHDVYYFSKVFKKFTGTTPSKFRQLNGSSMNIKST